MAFDWSFSAQQDVAPNSEDHNFFATDFSMNNAHLREFASDDWRNPDRAFDYLRVNAAVRPPSFDTPWVDQGCVCGLSDVVCSKHSRFVPTSTYVHHTTDSFREASISAGPSTQPTDVVDTAPYQSATIPVNPVWAVNSSSVPEQGCAIKRTNRTIIPKEAKHILEQHFAVDRYPPFVGINLLARKTNLTFKTVRMWFANTRSRKRKSKGKSVNVMSGGRSLDIHYSGSSFSAYIRARPQVYEIGFISGPEFYKIS